MKWSDEEDEFLRKNYPAKGKMWCAENLGRSEASIRQRAARLALRCEIGSDHFKEWQGRAAASKIGKKRPDQAIVMKEMWKNGAFEEYRKTVRGKWPPPFEKWFAKNGHPRDMAGKKHGDEAKNKISDASLRAWQSRSQEERDDYAFKLRSARKAPHFRPNATWKAGWREIGDARIYARSSWEANYARYLEWLRERGEILAWEHEPDTFWFEGIKRGVVSYLPDFKVTERNGSIVYHEVKGWMDDRSRTCLKRMAKYHPNVKLLLIDAKAYRAISRSISMMIEGWEFTRT